MPNLKKRVMTGILALVMALSLVACDSGDPSETTQPGDSETTAPVGS